MKTEKMQAFSLPQSLSDDTSISRLEADVCHNVCCEAWGLQHEGESVGRVVYRDWLCYHATG